MATNNPTDKSERQRERRNRAFDEEMELMRANIDSRTIPDRHPREPPTGTASSRELERATGSSGAVGVQSRQYSLRNQHTGLATGRSESPIPTSGLPLPRTNARDPRYWELMDIIRTSEALSEASLPSATTSRSRPLQNDVRRTTMPYSKDGPSVVSPFKVYEHGDTGGVDPRQPALLPSAPKISPGAGLELRRKDELSQVKKQDLSGPLRLPPAPLRQPQRKAAGSLEFMRRPSLIPRPSPSLQSEQDRASAVGTAGPSRPNRQRGVPGSMKDAPRPVSPCPQITSEKTEGYGAKPGDLVRYPLISPPSMVSSELRAGAGARQEVAKRPFSLSPQIVSEKNGGDTAKSADLVRYPLISPPSTVSSEFRAGAVGRQEVAKRPFSLSPQVFSEETGGYTAMSVDSVRYPLISPPSTGSSESRAGAVRPHEVAERPFSLSPPPESRSRFKGKAVRALEAAEDPFSAGAPRATSLQSKERESGPLVVRRPYPSLSTTSPASEAGDGASSSMGTRARLMPSQRPTPMATPFRIPRLLPVRATPPDTRQPTDLTFSPLSSPLTFAKVAKELPLLGEMLALGEQWAEMQR